MQFGVRVEETSRTFAHLYQRPPLFAAFFFSPESPRSFGSMETRATKSFVLEPEVCAIISPPHKSSGRNALASPLDGSLCRRYAGQTLMIKTCYATVIALALVIGLGAAHAQAILAPAEPLVHPAGIKLSGVCVDPAIPRQLHEALRLACMRSPQIAANPVSGKTIVIGFVGGFVKHDDTRHPEVLFAEFLRERFGPAVHVEVFANHNGKQALRRVESILDSNGDGILAPAEKEQARIIIYGHSWGAAQTVRLARELKQQGIPVLLTIQMDSIHKPGQNDSRIPDNVEKAV